ncbi:MAG: hypothetical protein ACPGQL_06305 [Thermoplasmatota archaeon]
MTTPTGGRHFPYRFDDRWKGLFALLGVKRTDGVTVTEDGRLVATYGRWRIDTPLANVAATEVTGPHRWYTAVGLRLSFTDTSITFGTNHKLGLSITFKEKLPKVIGRKDHRFLWVSVEQPEALAAALATARATRRTD